MDKTRRLKNLLKPIADPFTIVQLLIIIGLVSTSLLLIISTPVLSSFHFGPIDAVESEVNQLDDMANKHWTELFVEKCEYDPDPENCAGSVGIPRHVWRHWFADNRKRQSLDLDGDFYINLVFDQEPMAGNGGGVYGGALELTDFSGDGVADLAVTGMDGNKNPRLIIYLNDGNGNFITTEEPLIGEGHGLQQSDFAAADFTGDSTIDLAVAGKDINENHRLIILSQNGGQFSIIEEPMINNNDGTGVWTASLDHGDITGNGVPNLVVSGRDQADQPRLLIYHKERHSDTFVTYQEPMLEDGNGVWNGSVRLANFTERYRDFSGGAYMDLAVTGRDGGEEDGRPRFKLYDNRRNIGFTELSTPLSDTDGLWASSIDFADFTHNDRLDMAISGLDIHDQPRLILYKNIGNGQFEYHSEPLKNITDGLAGSALEFADMTNNGSPDLLVAGRTKDYKPKFFIFLNDGNGNFTKHTQPLAEDPAINLQGFWSPSIAVGDYTGNGRLDMAISGSETDPSRLPPVPRLLLFENQLP